MNMGVARQTAFLALAAHLAQQGYTFVCPTPESQARVVQQRSGEHCTTLADFFGWSLPADEKTLITLLPLALLDQLRVASIVTAERDGLSKANFRLSNFYLPHIGDSETVRRNSLYYIHSAFPTKDDDAVFFGPDTYFFLDFLDRASSHLSRKTPTTVVDLCCGSGAGAIHVSHAYPGSTVLGLDLNPRALGLGRINAVLAECHVDFVESNLYSAISSRTDIDLIMSNPPYIASSADGDIPVYAAGGAQQGLALPLRIVEEGVKLLAKNGLLMMYTGVPISYRRPGHDPFLERLEALQDMELLEYRIIHPDMWAEEVGKGAYAEVGRIQVVGAVLRKRG
ncbi:hypothetical protein LTR66_002416 [Elasticomyces elasticus]|nr:hypothetical protein LTR66_002416 [Elasticomyces elasticus]